MLCLENERTAYKWLECSENCHTNQAAGDTYQNYGE